MVWDVTAASRARTHADIVRLGSSTEQVGTSRNSCVPHPATAPYKSEPANHILTAADPLPGDLRDALVTITSRNTHSFGPSQLCRNLAAQSPQSATIPSAVGPTSAG